MSCFSGCDGLFTIVVMVLRRVQDILFFLYRHVVKTFLSLSHVYLVHFPPSKATSVVPEIGSHDLPLRIQTKDALQLRTLAPSSHKPI